MEANFDDLMRQATELQLAGQLSEAESLYSKLIALSPACAEAYHRLGLIFWEKENLKVALENVQKAIAINPQEARYHCSHGQILTTKKEFLQAITAFEKALKLKPDFVDALFGAGLSFQETKQLDKAIAVYRIAIALSPTYVDAYNNLGNVLAANYQFKEAIEVLLKALNLEPSAKIWCNLGNALNEAGEFNRAVDAYRNAIYHDPSYIDAYLNLSKLILNLSGNETSAPPLKKWRIEESIEILKKAILLHPNSSRAYAGLGNALSKTGKLQEALDCYRKAIALNPEDIGNYNRLLFITQFHPDYTSPKILEEALKFNKLYTASLASCISPHKNDRNQERRLRIGYVSPDFRGHVQALFTIPLLTHHNREAFQVFCYADVVKPDSVTEKIKTYADHWCPIGNLSDEEAAEKIRSDKIDILVDLTMHMAGSRPLLFARKPAPIQVAYLAYPGTTGLATMDYRLTDPYLDPSKEWDAFYSERSIRLPDTFWCYDPLAVSDERTEVAPLPALKNGYVTFGCLNEFFKVSDQTIRLWGTCLRQIPTSRLILLCPNGSPRQDVLKKLAPFGVAPERIEFVGRHPRKDYLAIYGRIDISLDTIPYNGHTTSLDSFWMSVPVVTRIGKTVVGRAGLSLLSNLGLRDLAAETDQDFVEIVTKLANDLPKLTHLRATLREQLEKSPIMDAAVFARNIEKAYRQMWQTWCNLSD